jgi:dTDP-4-dehydrorhamnose reductase
MLRRAQDGQPIKVVEDHIGSPTYAPLLAARTIDLLEKDQHGVFHIAGGTPIPWFHFAKLIFETAGLNPPLQATNEREYRTPARRPKYSALSNEKMERAGIAQCPAADCVRPTSPSAKSREFGQGSVKTCVEGNQISRAIRLKRSPFH